MKEKRILIIKKGLRALEILVNIVALAFGLQILVSFQADKMIIAFIALCISFLLCAVNIGAEKWLVFVKYLVYASVCALEAVLVYIHRDSVTLFANTFYIYAAMMIFGRVVSILNWKKILNTCINILLILIWIIAPISVLVLEKMLGEFVALIGLGVMIPVQIIIRITQLSFSHIRYDILFKVIRKSMVPEILTGLMILIVSFSVGFYYIEPSIETYTDGLWYCFAIVTTIGFGDISAVTGLGRAMSVILGIYGIIVVSLITSVIVNFYMEINKEQNDLARLNTAAEINSEGKAGMISTADAADAQNPSEKKGQA